MEARSAVIRDGPTCIALRSMRATDARGLECYLSFTKAGRHRFEQRKPVMNAAPTYDILLQGGHVICPASGIDGVMDVAIAGGKIAQFGKSVIPSSAKQVIDARGKLVLPGMIDTHAHIYRYVTGRFGLDADMVGVQSGVTTLLDQGGASCMTFPGFRHF